MNGERNVKLIRILRRTSLLGLLLASALPFHGSAQRFLTSGGKAGSRGIDDSTRTLPQNDPAIEQFWSKFKAAVQKSDKTSVGAMSQFPIEMPYGVAKIRNRSQLARRWRDLFNVQANAVKCFGESKPVVDSADAKLFTVGCKDVAGNEVVVYGFRLGRTGWKLAFLDNINE